MVIKKNIFKKKSEKRGLGKIRTNPFKVDMGGYMKKYK
jgi:hypothetical protein